MTRKELGYVELEWTCKHCGTVNPGMKRVCTNCGAPISQDDKFELPDQQQLITDKEKLEEAKTGAAIHCPYCNVLNPAGTKLCIQCGGDIQEGLKRQAGGVLGAYQTAAVPDKPCPSCGQMVKADAERCPNCGGSLQEAAIPTAPPASVQPKKTPLWLIIGGAVVGLLCLTAIIVFIVMGNRTRQVTASVAGLYWQRSVEILAQKPLHHSAWEEDIPSGAQEVACRDEYKETSTNPQPKSTEVCGTPYTIDTGSGAGQVVQDCEYLVYASYCTFTQLDWAVLDTAMAEGNDNQPLWPQYSLLAGQQEGNRHETYQVLFAAGEKNYSYSVSDFNEFSRFEIASQWLLDINTFGEIKDVQLK